MADQRVQFGEKVRGANAPAGLEDTINRLTLVEHNSDGTHKKESRIVDYGAKATDFSIDLSTSDMHIVEFSAAATLTLSSTLTNDKAIVVVKNGGFVITVAGVDNNPPTLTNAASKQDFLGIVKSLGKITCVASLLNQATV